MKCYTTHNPGQSYSKIRSTNEITGEGSYHDNAKWPEEIPNYTVMTIQKRGEFYDNENGHKEDSRAPPADKHEITSL